MRNDISSEIIAKTSLNAQTPANNANPQLSLTVARKQTMLTDIDYTERRRVATTTLNTVTDVSIAVCHPRLNTDDTEIYIAYVQSSKLHVRHSKATADVSDINWEEVDFGGDIAATKCDIGFRSWKQTNARGVTEYVTTRYPWVFILGLGRIYCIDLKDFETTTIVDGYAADLTVRQTPAGLGLFYTKSTGGVFYKIFGTEWSAETAVGVSFSGTVEGLSSFTGTVYDSGVYDAVGLQIYSNGYVYRLMGKYDNGFTWGTWDVCLQSTGTAAIVEYYDSEYPLVKREAFWNHGGLKYSEMNVNWQAPEERDLYPPVYSVIEFDHTNQGTVYLATVMHRESSDVIYFFRYVYMKDASNYVSSVTKVLQVDNPITQINATLKNINSTLFVADATLFAPSAMMRLGVRYGNTDLVDLGYAYIDEVSYQYGGKSISVSGRNVTGVCFNDQTFDEKVQYTDTPSNIIEFIIERFDNTADFEIDERGDLDGGNTRFLDVTFDPETTGLEALETLNDLLTNESAGNKWAFEEMYDGTLVFGYDDFRAQYIPKNHYTFNGRTDVFAEAIDRCIDGVYTQVRCTGTTQKGKEIEYTYPVETFRFWVPGEHRTYHAEPIEGISKDNLKKYAKALAKELKYAGRVMTYKSNLKPQLLIGDVAEVTYGVESGADPEMLGSITEISHTMGEKGYFTEFTITSGGNVNNASVPTVTQTRSATVSNPGLVYVAESAKKGTNRKSRLADYLGGTGKSTTMNVASITQILEGGALNFVELIRNIGFRLLDEPSNVQAEYDAENNQIKLKWTDPSDIATSEPCSATWAGTVVVRSSNGEPLHRWDGTLIVDSTTKNEYASSWLVDSNVEKGTVYYYAIMPYDTKGDYRYTKVVQIQAGGDLENPVITSIEMGGSGNTKVIVDYTIPSGTYSYIKLVYKKDAIPTSYSDGTAIDITQSSTEAEISGIADGDTYYFVIFTDKSTSEPKQFTTTEPIVIIHNVIDAFKQLDFSTVQEFTDLSDVSNAYINSNPSIISALENKQIVFLTMQSSANYTIDIADDILSFSVPSGNENTTKIILPFDKIDNIVLMSEYLKFISSSSGNYFYTNYGYLESGEFKSTGFGFNGIAALDWTQKENAPTESSSEFITLSILHEPSASSGATLKLKDVFITERR